MERQVKKAAGVRKRSAAACVRCRQQKIRCSGTVPCTSCFKRSLVCDFDDSSQKVLVTKRYLKDLQDRADNRVMGVDKSENNPPAGSEIEGEGQMLREDVNRWLGTVAGSAQQQAPSESEESTEDAAQRGSASPPHLLNPLAVDSENYIATKSGRPYHLGTSSNWSFGLRVLRLACERLGVELPSEGLHFEGQVYDLDWQLLRQTPHLYAHLLPSADHAVYLINAVKFHCGQIFHLFDETSFMQNFAVFHEAGNNIDKVPQLWYVHYLLIVAFGKAFVAHSMQDGRPPGAELFLEAMKHLPEITLFITEPIEAIEILICAALYLQCLDFRSLAFNLIGQAVRKALEIGMHTSMSSRHLTDDELQRYRKVWWTSYVLDRQMSSLMGLPVTIRDEDITAALPVYAQSQSRELVMELHVKLSKIIADILNTIYSSEGRRSTRFLASTKRALKSLAAITSSLNQTFGIPDSESVAGISRTAAYLQLLHHQCIVLTTRPLIYNFFERRLSDTRSSFARSRLKGSVRALLTACVDSAQQMLHILSCLQKQGLLESFLPFDLESVFISMMILTMSTVVESSLIDNYQSWSIIADSILDEMSSRGNMIASFRKRELQKLANIVSNIPEPQASDRSRPGHLPQHTPTDPEAVMNFDRTPTQRNTKDNFDELLLQRTDWQEELSAEQLMLVADTLDLDGLDWMTTSLGESSSIDAFPNAVI